MLPTISTKTPSVIITNGNRALVRKAGVPRTHRAVVTEHGLTFKRVKGTMYIEDPQYAPTIHDEIQGEITDQTTKRVLEITVQKPNE